MEESVNNTEIELTLFVDGEEIDSADDLDLEPVSMDQTALSLISSRRC
ncbi:MAG: hypothetical protein ABMA64_07640 [Myxococcota bacterium]